MGKESHAINSNALANALHLLHVVPFYLL
jgi:hypothetical protein